MQEHSAPKQSAAPMQRSLLKKALLHAKQTTAAYLAPVPLLLRIIISARGLDMVIQIILLLVAIVGIAGNAGFLALVNDNVSAAVGAYADSRQFWPIFGKAVGYAVGVTVSQFLLEIARLFLALMWRKILLQRLVLPAYFKDQALYQLASSAQSRNSQYSSITDNPDQRITNDAYIFCEYSAQIVVTGTSTIVTCIAAVVSLLMIASSTWIQIVILVPFVLFNSVFYNLIAPWIASGVVQIEHAEGDFRFSHARVREFAESIAFLQGGEAQRSNTSRLFARLISLTKGLAVRFMTLTFYDTFSGELLRAILFAMLVIQVQYKLAPFNDPSLTTEKKAALIANIHLQVFAMALSQQQAFQLTSTIVYIAGAGARVAQLLASCAGIAKQKKMMEQAAQGKVEFVEDRIELQGVTVATPVHGEPEQPVATKTLVKDLSLTVLQGQNLIITGKSGCGKSSILRVIAGLWKSQSGTVRRPKLIGRDGIFFVPQRPYIIKGNLKEQILFPMTLEEYEKLAQAVPSTSPSSPSYGTAGSDEPPTPRGPSDTALLEALRRANLLSLRDKIDWDDRSIVLQNTLSGGEMQRLGFARLFFHRPRFAIIDEGTAAMDAENELIMYEQCKELGITLISVAHRSTLLKFHQMRLHVLGDAQAGYQLEPIETQAESSPGTADSPKPEDIGSTIDGKEDDEDSNAVTSAQPLIHSAHKRISSIFDAPDEDDQSISLIQRIGLFIKYSFYGFITLVDTRNAKGVVRTIIEAMAFVVLIVIVTVATFLAIALPQLSLDALVAYDISSSWGYSGGIFGMAVTLILFMPLVIFAQRRIGIRWRENSTGLLQKEYYKANNFYKLNVLDQAYEAPERVGDADQRISVDVDFVASGLREFGTQRYFVIGIRSIVNVVIAFGVSIYMLHWSTPLLALAWVLPCFLVQGTMNLIVSRFQVRQQRKEGDFRFDLARIREFAEQICFFNGEKSEYAHVGADLRAVLQQQTKLIIGQISVRVVSFFAFNFGVCISLLIVALIVFTGIVPYSDSMASTVTIAAGQLASLIAAATDVTDLASEVVKSFGSMVRIGQLLVRSRELARTKAYEQSQPEQVRSGTEGALAVDALSFAAAGKQLKQRTLVKDLNLELKAGDRLLVKGPSGSGKSSLLRVVAGLWPFQRGTITRPTPSSSYGVNATTPLNSTSSMAIIFENQSIDPGANNTSLPQLKGMQFVPQRAYVPLGISLGAVVTYPEPFTPQVADRVRECISKVGLGYLLDRYAGDSDLDTTAQHLQTVLSEGEQQRLAFARVLFQRPSLIILDESTSALDEDNEKLMYSLIQETLPGATVMSVGHRETLNAFHL